MRSGCAMGVHAMGMPRGLHKILRVCYRPAVGLPWVRWGCAWRGNANRKRAGRARRVCHKTAVRCHGCTVGDGSAMCRAIGMMLWVHPPPQVWHGHGIGIGRVPWVRYGCACLSAVGPPPPWICNGCVAGLPRVCHGRALGLAYVWYGCAMDMPWVWHVYANAASWARHGHDIGVPWVCCGCVVICCLTDRPGRTTVMLCLAMVVL